MEHALIGCNKIYKNRNSQKARNLRRFAPNHFVFKEAKLIYFEIGGRTQGGENHQRFNDNMACQNDIMV